MVERFNGRIGSEVVGITIYSHRQLKQLMRGLNTAYNARRQRVLDGRTPDQVVAERIDAKPELVRLNPHGRAGLCDTPKARLIAKRAKGSHNRVVSLELCVAREAWVQAPVLLPRGFVRTFEW